MFFGVALYSHTMDTVQDCCESSQSLSREPRRCCPIQFLQCSTTDTNVCFHSLQQGRKEGGLCDYTEQLKEQLLAHTFLYGSCSLVLKQQINKRTY